LIFFELHTHTHFSKVGIGPPCIDAADIADEQLSSWTGRARPRELYRSTARWTTIIVNMYGSSQPHTHSHKASPLPTLSTTSTDGRARRAVAVTRSNSLKQQTLDGWMQGK